MKLTRIFALLCLLLVSYTLFAQTRPVTARITFATGGTPATGWTLHRGTVSGGPYTQIGGTNPATTLTYADTVVPGTYYYVVYALNGAVPSVRSDEALVVITLAAPGKPTVTITIQ